MTIARSIASAVAKPIAKPVASVGASGSAAALDIRASVGTFTAPVSTGSNALTGFGFQPKAFLPFGVDTNATGASVPLVLGLGAGLSSSSRAAIGVSSVNAVTTSATHRGHTSSNVIAQVYNGSALRTADLTSLDSDGATLNWTAAGLAAIFNRIALGGADLEVSLTQQQMNGTNAAQSFAHGLSGAPTGVLFFSAIETLVPPQTSIFLNLGIGAWAGSSQLNGFVRAASGLTTTSTRRRLSTSGVCCWTNDSGTLQREMAVSTVDATNVNVTYPTTVDSSQVRFWMLAIRGAKCQVGTFNKASSNTIVTTGITPKLFLPVFVPSGVGSVGSVLNDLMLTIGASDGTNNVSCGISDANGVTTTNARRFQSSTTLCEFNTAGTKSFEATAAFSGESIVVTPTTSNTNFGQAGYICLGS